MADRIKLIVRSYARSPKFTGIASSDGRRLEESTMDVEGASLEARGRCLWFDADEPIAEARAIAAVQLLVDAAAKVSYSYRARVAVRSCGQVVRRRKDGCARGRTFVR